MSWRVLLSEYPQSILGSELPLIVLALVERGGMVTEDELTTQTGTSKAGVLEVLLGLHRNKLVEYAGSCTRLSERGKRIIDRFDLSRDLAHDIVSGLPLDSEHKERLTAALLEYREHDFREYIESVGTARNWVRACAWEPLKSGLTTDEINVGVLAALLHDLGHFRAAHASKYGALGNSLMRAVKTQENQILERAMKWMAKTESLEASLDPWQALTKEEREPGFVVWYLHTSSRRHLSSPAWLEEWSPSGEWNRVITACRSIREIPTRCVKFGEREWPSRPVWRRSERPLLASETTSEGANIDLGDIVTQMFLAASFEDLVRRSKLGAEPLRDMIRRIGQRCRSLLSETVESKGTSKDPARKRRD